MNDAPFIPRRGRVMAIITALISVVLFGLIAVLLPGFDVGGRWGPVDKLMVFGLGLAVAALLVRYARIGAWPQAEGLRVRNLMVSQLLPWQEIEDIRFDGGDPWVQIDLVAGETIAVMAIQRADGDEGVAQAQRLAELVAERQRTTPH